jgi:hypothetical protein
VLRLNNEMVQFLVSVIVSLPIRLSGFKV